MAPSKLTQVALALIAFVPSIALPAPCCGGHAALPTLITGYESYRFNSAFTGARVIGDAPDQGLSVFRDPETQLQTGTLQLSGSARLTDSFQIGAALGASTSAERLGDADLIAAYEIVHREDVTSLAPQVLLFSQLTLPTGRSRYESQEANLKDVTGTGFYKLGIGAVALTTWRKWDGYGLLRASNSLSREFSGSVSRVTPGWTGDLAAGFGYSPNGDWRLGLSVQSSFSEGLRIERPGAVDTSGSTLVWPVQAQVTWFKDSNSTFSVSYLDETLLGPARNTTLSRSISFQYGYRWGSDASL